MSKTFLRPIYGTRGRWARCINKSHNHRLRGEESLEERTEGNREAESSDDDETWSYKGNTDCQFPYTSLNFVDYLKSREINRKFYSADRTYGNRFMLSNEMFVETKINLGSIDKVRCSQWLSDRQIIMGTKCNKLLVYDIKNRKLNHVPFLKSRGPPILAQEDLDFGLRAMKVNPSRTLLATHGDYSNDVAVYKLPNFDPLYVGEEAHRKPIHDICWINDEYFVSGSSDERLAIWKINPDVEEDSADFPEHRSIFAEGIYADFLGIKAITYKETSSEVATLNLGSSVHIWDAPTLLKKLSRKLPVREEGRSFALQKAGNNLFAIGCETMTLLLDSRMLHYAQYVMLPEARGILTAAFYGNILTLGTGAGILKFYDIRAKKYLESCLDAGTEVTLKAGNVSIIDEASHEPSRTTKAAIFTLCYDSQGIRLFTGGGPRQNTFKGHHAAIWQ